MSHVASGTGPSIAAGDLNTSMWSSSYVSLLRDSGLKDSRRGFGILPTWLTRRPIVALVPQDYCLVSLEFVVNNCIIGAAFGSDHLALIVDLSMPRTKSRTTPE
ncbi:MAG: hypothetical protein QGG73_09860 [Candidatus Hydrogenedentes bacterium]|nr:hypothetical protein [Candidatus Hydrogenedentota bacterium]